MSHRKEHRREVKYTDCRTKKVTAEEARIRKLKVFKAKICKVTSKTVDAKDFILDGVSLSSFINGDTNVSGITASFDNVVCNPEDQFGCYTPVLPLGSPMNPLVFQGLKDSAYEIVYGPNGLQERIDEGRLRLGLEPSKGVQLVGSITMPSSYLTPSLEPNLPDILSFVTSLTWDLQAANSTEYVDGYKPSPLVVSVLGHVGWIDETTNEFKQKTIYFGNQQLNPTIDYKDDPDFIDAESWGEKYNGQMGVDSDTVKVMGKTGLIQIMLFREVGIRVYFPDEAGTCGTDFPECRANTTVIQCQNNCSIGVTNTNSVQTTVSQSIV